MTITKLFAATTAIGLVAASGAALAQTSATPSAAPGSQTTGTPAATSPAASNQPGAATGGAVALAQGATVYDPQGGTVGSIESVDGGFAVLATAKSKVKLPSSSFATGAKGPVIAMTAAQIDQAAAQAAPTASAAATPAKVDVVKGKAVADTQGAAVGTVTEVDAQFATVDLTTGVKVRLPVSAFGAGENGGLRVANTAAQLSAAASASGGTSGGSN